MPESYTESTPRPVGTYDMLQSVDKNVRALSDELYDFKREMNSRLTRLEEDMSVVKKDLTDLKITTGVMERELSALKEDMKEVRREMSDMKGSIRELSGSIAGLQTRFNWGLVILGLIIALIQMLK